MGMRPSARGHSTHTEGEGYIPNPQSKTEGFFWQKSSEATKEYPGGQLLIIGQGILGRWEQGTQLMVVTSRLLVSERYPLLHTPWHVLLFDGMGTTDDVKSGGHATHAVSAHTRRNPGGQKLTVHSLHS